MKAPFFDLRKNVIQCRVTNGAKNVARLSTGLSVKDDRWIKEKQTTVGITAGEKKINSILRKITELVEDDVTTRILTSNWLKEIINESKGISSRKDSLLLLNLFREFIDSKSKKAFNTISSYERAFDLLTEFIDGKEIYLMDANSEFITKFYNWLQKGKLIGNNTAILYSRFIISVVNYCATVKGFDVPKVGGFTEKKDTRTKAEIIALNPDEIQAIKDLKGLSEALDNSRKYVLIGVEIGQRAGDLLSISEKNIKGNRLYLTQQKTNKDVIIPITDETANLIRSIAYDITIHTLNRNIRKLCEMAKIDTIVKKKVNVNGVESVVEMKKWEAVGSHVLRRSYVTNMYNKMPLALIMSVTKHSTEAMLIKYMGLTDEEIADQYEKERDKLK